MEDYKSLYSKKMELDKEYIILTNKKQQLVDSLGPYPDILLLEEKKKQLLVEVGILEDISNLYAIKDNLQEEVSIILYYLVCFIVMLYDIVCCRWTASSNRLTSWAASSSPTKSLQRAPVQLLHGRCRRPRTSSTMLKLKVKLSKPK